ncbi:MAG: hypothetical protein ACYCOU_06580 [Sulfobacillus sp.]
MDWCSYEHRPKLLHGSNFVRHGRHPDHLSARAMYCDGVGVPEQRGKLRSHAIAHIVRTGHLQTLPADEKTGAVVIVDVSGLCDMLQNGCIAAAIPPTPAPKTNAC